MIYIAQIEKATSHKYIAKQNVSIESLKWKNCMNNPHQFNSNGYTGLPSMNSVQLPEQCKLEPISGAMRTQ